MSTDIKPIDFLPVKGRPDSEIQSTGAAAFIAKHSGIFVAILLIITAALLFLTYKLTKFTPIVEPVDCIEGTTWGHTDSNGVFRQNEWSECSKECGGGAKFQYRQGDTPARGAGKKCSPDVKVQQCNDFSCDRDYVIGIWGAWGACNKNCGPGMQLRRTVGDISSSGTGKTSTDIMTEMNDNGGYDGIEVKYNTDNKHFYQTRPCEIVPCPIDCSVDWDPAIDVIPGTTYKNPKYDIAKAFQYLSDGITPNLLYEPEFIPNPISMEIIPNPLYDPMEEIQIPNPHHIPGDPAQPEYIINPYKQPEYISNPDYNSSAPTIKKNPYFEPQRLVVPNDPWGNTNWKKSDGYSYCMDQNNEYAPCGLGGVQKRTGTITQQPLYGGKSCGTGLAFTINGNSITETHNCNQIGCPLDCKLGDWIPVDSKPKPTNAEYSCASSNLVQDNLLRAKGWNDCTKKCVDITTNTGPGTRRRNRKSTTPMNGGDPCDPNDLYEEVECNNFRCPDIRDFLGVWKLLNDFNHASNNDETDFIAFKSFAIYYNPGLVINNSKTRENGFYNIYLNIIDKTNDFPNVTNLILGKTDPLKYKLQLYDNMWRLYDLVLETPTQLTIHVQNLITHEKYDVCFEKINNTSVLLPGIGTVNGWRYSQYDTVKMLPKADTGVDYDTILSAPLPTPDNWVYQTTDEFGADAQYAGSCIHNYDTALYSFYCPTNENIPFNFDLYLGKWKVEGSNPVKFYNITKVGQDYRMYFDPSNVGYYPLYESEYLPHLLYGVKQGVTPADNEYFIIHKPDDTSGNVVAKMTGFKLKKIDATKQIFTPELTTPGSLLWTGDVSYDPISGEMSFE